MLTSKLHDSFNSLFLFFQTKKTKRFDFPQDFKGKTNAPPSSAMLVGAGAHFARHLMVIGTSQLFSK